MYAAALLIATAAVGVDTGWRPAQDDPESVQYIIQIEPEVLKKMLRDGTPIDSIVPPDVPGGVIRCFRVQLGEDELPRELPEVAKATYNAEIDSESSTLRKIEAAPLELNPAPDNRSTASTATPPLNALAADTPTPRYSNTLTPGSGTPLNPTRTAADTNPSLSGTGSNFSIPSTSTTTPVAGSTPTSRFNTAPLSTSSSASTTYQSSGGYPSSVGTTPAPEYPAYSPPPLSASSTPLGGGTSPLGGNTNTNTGGTGNFTRFGDNYATPTGGTSGGSTNYNTGNNSYSSPLGNNNTTGGTGSNLDNTYQGSLTPINSNPPQNNQNNNPQNNNGSYVPPSNQQQQQQPNYNQNNNYPQPAPNYPPQQQQQPFPYNQPGYVNTYGQMANPNYYPQMGYPPQYNPYLMAALPGMGAPALTPPGQQQPAATPPAATTPTPAASPSDRTARDGDDEKPQTPPVEVSRPYWMLVMVAFLSLGFNIYMGWMVVDFRTKYRDILAGFRELKAAN
ncbi:hypothetical protein [Blastopirellula marina]|uniref:Uncharacterized protein n=1 Tax=Blastopirellula marina TaxID=124 RepID=A0A2S8G6Z9_9BACT|nr:hypothetical protein [Blastopirellula marina]PQO40193.1 hypothetical protein C5Y98_06205 [Blastopirellula marina]PTL45560.1 hypothetical protein C5Y97_06205 [Blastopirellula marina]